MADRWIVSSHEYHQHRTVEGAKTERNRLSELFPDRKFKIYRIKTQLGPTRSKQIIDDLTAEVEELRSRLAGYDSEA